LVWFWVPLHWDYITTLQESNSYRRNILERAQYLPIQINILCNTKEIELDHLPKIKSVFILSIAPIMLLETLRISNCDELKYIIIDTGDHNTGGNNWVNVFPKLNKIHVRCCAQLEYIFGHDINDHQNQMEVQLHFPHNISICLTNLPSLVAMCPKQYRTTFPSLNVLNSRIVPSLISNLLVISLLIPIQNLWIIQSLRYPSFHSFHVSLLFLNLITEFNLNQRMALYFNWRKTKLNL
jgi:hypothetical protein